MHRACAVSQQATKFETRASGEVLHLIAHSKPSSRAPVSFLASRKELPSRRPPALTALLISHAMIGCVAEPPRRSRRRERVPIADRPFLFADEVALVEGIDQSQVYRNAIAGRYGPTYRTVGGGVRILKSAIPLWPAWEAMLRDGKRTLPTTSPASDELPG